MKRMNLSFFVALALVAAGIMGMIVALQLPFSTPISKIGGPGTFPTAYLVVIIFFSSILAVTELVKSFSASGSSEPAQAFGKMGKKDVIRVLLLIAAVTIYILNLNKVGFKISTPLLILVSLWLFGYRNKIISPVLAIGFPALLYLLFRTVLKISLP